MKKRVLSILCLTALLCLFLQTVLVAGNLEGVDYDRITGTDSHVTLTMGELVF